ncbi:acyl-CoA dehydrogenase family protein [Phenylobacterium sp.]|uniref:acyl-CoA dehydrogenase family protein n=1 Tax=Phenylobacterium sp. TaxID=1871053 RepID=UPI0025F12CC0|nr:acyl-CoA dehydrogenase family protein [Phenylobacterium sp.]
MDFDLPKDDDPRRLDVRAWFERHPNPTGRELFAAGYVVPHWPRPWGLDADTELQLIIDDEIKRAGLPAPSSVNPVAINNCAQSLLTHGTPEQQARFLPPALSYEEGWCMLFSEPSGGSDLGGLRTSAQREGDHYVVRGQKIWTSNAHTSKIGVLVARTDPTASKHAGLSQFLIDMDAPGVTVRPIQDMTGAAHEYNEVFLDDVRVPADRLLGKEGEGWRLSNLQLQTERAALSKPGAVWGQGPSARDLVKALIQTGHIDDPGVRDEAAQLYIEGELLRLLAYRALTDRMNATPSGPEAAVRKMLAAPHGQRLLDLAKRVQGQGGLVEGEEIFPLPNESRHLFDNWDYAFWFSPAVTLGVGTQEILKNVLGERLLGLPRDVDPTAKGPWIDTQRPELKPAN